MRAGTGSTSSLGMARLFQLKKKPIRQASDSPSSGK